MAKEKERLDVLLVNRGLAVSREKAKTLIMAGDVFVNGQREDKPGTTFEESKIKTLEVKGDTLPYFIISAATCSARSRPSGFLPPAVA